MNDVYLLGQKLEGELEPKIVTRRNRFGEVENDIVLNFLIQTFNEKLDRSYNLPIAIWGEQMVEQCLEHLKSNDFVSVKGEIRNKTHYNHEKQEIERIFTAVKTSNIEFLSKKFGTQDPDLFEDMYENKVRLCGNLTDDIIETEEGYRIAQVAIDRLYPTKEVIKSKTPNSELTDFITVMLDSETKLKGEFKQGAVVYLRGSLVTRKRRFGIVEPRIVVKADKMVGKVKGAILFETIEELVTIGESADEVVGA